MEVLTQPNDIIHSSTAISADGTCGSEVSRCSLTTPAGVELLTRGIKVMHESSVGLGALPLGGLAPSAVQFLNQENTEIGLHRGHKRVKETLKSAVMVTKFPHIFLL